MAYDEPAFPFEYEGDGGQRVNHAGMGLRDYFAAQALPMIIELMFRPELSHHLENDTVTAGVAAQKSYLFADAMIERRMSSRSPQGSDEANG